jgi:hypothetical protein
VIGASLLAISLVAISVLWGVTTFFVFRRFTDAAALRKIRRLLYAHLLEIRLFADEPGLVWKAQKAVFADNLRLLRLVAIPVALLALPFALLYEPLNDIYGWGPLAVGQSATVTLQERNTGADLNLVAPPGIGVETLPVKSMADHEVSWRIRPLIATMGTLRAGAASRSIMAGDRTLARRRQRESMPDGGWFEVDYPRADITLLGIPLPWLTWFVIFSTLSAGATKALRRRN